MESLGGTSTRHHDSGLLVELSRGLFQLQETGGIDQIDFVVVCAHAPQGMVCLRSALAYWDLSDESPDQWTSPFRQGAIAR